MFNAKKPLPFPEPPMSAADKNAVNDISKHVQRAQLLGEFATINRLEPVYERRRQLVSKIPKFWVIAMLRHAGLAEDLKLEEDHHALQYLVDIWVRRNPAEPRVYTLEFTFSQNPYFADGILRKVYTFTESPARRKEVTDRDGFKWSMLDFDWENDVKALPCRINWKPGRNLCRKYPKAVDRDGEIETLGSFFNWFEHDGDAFDIGTIIADELFPDVIQYFNGEIDHDDEDEDKHGQEGYENQYEDNRYRNSGNRW